MAGPGLLPPERHPGERRSSASLDDLQDRQKTNLYRIVQEALTNCAKHSKARSISILLKSFGAICASRSVMTE